ncbi:hypothetical protein T492DRAFT_867321 [Pavlovales sp. CCMP2436]|nr:hypothetical protein T492DRAFT_867321 [Pavlovales sp. CCMP2436]
MGGASAATLTAAFVLGGAFLAMSVAQLRELCKARDANEHATQAAQAAAQAEAAQLRAELSRARVANAQAMRGASQAANATQATQAALQAKAAQLYTELCEARGTTARATQAAQTAWTAQAAAQAEEGQLSAQLRNERATYAQQAARDVFQATQAAQAAEAIAQAEAAQLRAAQQGARIAQALEKAYQSHAQGAAPVRFYLSVNRAIVPYHVDLSSMVQMRLDHITAVRPIRRQLHPRAQWAAAPFDGPAKWSMPPATVWGVSGLSLQVAGAGSLRTRESLELNIALGHVARMCGAGQMTLPVRVDVCEATASVRVRFEAARTRLGGGNEEWVFHGTADNTIGQIFQQGFMVGGDGGVPVVNGNANGPSVYSDTLLPTALGYARGKKVILARALPGRIDKRRQTV